MRQDVSQQRWDSRAESGAALARLWRYPQIADYDIEPAMARHCKQHLATALELEAGSADIDVVWVESLLEFPNVKQDALGELASMSCALVSFVQAPQASARLSLLAASMTGVRTRRQRFSGSDPAEEFAASMRSRDDNFASSCSTTVQRRLWTFGSPWMRCGPETRTRPGWLS